MTTDLLHLVLLAFAGGVAGFLNVVAGGGSLITLPLLIFLGLPSTSANGTIRLAIFAQALTATVRYHRAGVVQWRRVPSLAIPTTVGAVAGALVASEMNADAFRSLIGWITLAAGALVVVDLRTVLSGKDSPGETAPSILRRTALIAVMLAVGFYGGLAQAGTGYLFLAAFVLVANMNLVDANIHKMVVVVFYVPFAIAIFGIKGQIHVPFALALTLGQVTGAYLGAGLTMKRGADFIRPILAVVVVAAGIKLIWG